MKRLFTLVLAAFIFAFTAPVVMHNAFADDATDAATSATDNAMKGDNAEHHHEHGAPASENTKTNGMKHTHAHHHHKHMHHHKKAEGAEKGAEKGGDAGTETSK